MTSDEYIKSKVVLKNVDNLLKDEKNMSSDRKKSDIINLILEGFNMGIFSMLESKKKLSDATMLAKSREVSSYLPDNFAKSDTGQQLVNSVQESIKTNSTESVLNIGYEPIVAKDIVSVIQIAYAIGLTAGFSISNDPDLKDMYSANSDRFVTHGAGGTK